MDQLVWRAQSGAEAASPLTPAYEGRPELRPVLVPHQPGWGSGGGGGGGVDDGQAGRAAGARMGVWALVASIAMMFLAITSTLLTQRAAGNWSVGPLPPVLYGTTAVLLASSLVVERAKARAARSDLAAAHKSLTVTAVMAAAFVVGQVIAWRSLLGLGIHLASSIHSAFFYLLTVAHALHVSGGVGALLWVMGRVRRAQEEGSSGLVMGSIRNFTVYWHFMGGLWVYLLGLLFLI